ncbi:MAG: hypothetical protein P1P90_01330 [Patescibacteria group bacterium]|nr:hypothetical protein [Patescibacteria group bacterium]
MQIPSGNMVLLCGNGSSRKPVAPMATSNIEMSFQTRLSGEYKMTKSATAATTTVSTTSSASDEAMDILREANGLYEKAPPASEERPSLHLLTPPPPPAVSEVKELPEPPRPTVVVHVCDCGATCADVAWCHELEMCKTCAALLVRKAEQKMWFCACGNRKLDKDYDLCVPCHKALLKEQAAERAAAEAAKLVCPKCGGKKDEAYHKMCRSCFTASRPVPAPRPQQARKVNGREVPKYKVDPRVQAKANARAKLGQELLAAHRAGTLDKSFTGAKATMDKADNAMVCIAYNGESYTLVDPAKVKAIAERKAEAAKAAQTAQAEAARKAAEARKAAAELAKANKSNEPKKGKKDKSGGKGKNKGK